MYLHSPSQFKIYNKTIYYQPVNSKVTKKTILTKRKFLSAIGFYETGFRLYFQTFVLSSNTKTGTRCNDQSRLLLIFTGSRLYHKYHSVGDEENNRLMIPNVIPRSFHCIANLSLCPDRHKLDSNHWKKNNTITWASCLLNNMLYSFHS